MADKEGKKSLEEFDEVITLIVACELIGRNGIGPGFRGYVTTAYLV